MVEHVRNSAQTIGATALIVVPTLEVGKRNAISIINTSTGGQIITLSWGVEAQAGKGIVLFTGGSWSESRDNVFTPSTEQIWAISSAAAGTLAIHDRIESEN